MGSAAGLRGAIAPMSLSPSTLPRSAHLVHVRPSRSDKGDPALREPLSRLAALTEPLAWQCATLALMVTTRSQHERVVWIEFARDLPDALRLFDDIATLPVHRRLPWFEHFARRLAPGPVAARQEVVIAARRMMTADGMVTRMDQLRWVALRHLLAGSAVSPPEAARDDLDVLDAELAHCVCVFSAFLSHLVPAPDLTLDLSGHQLVGQTWYDIVTAPWHDRLTVPLRSGHDIDASLRALRALQAMPWLLRPVLVRRWYDAARELTDGQALHAEAADALRLAGTLLDCPVPPELGRQFVEVDPPRG